MLYFLTFPPMHPHHHLVDALLSCGTLDSDYLLSLIDAYDLDAFELLEDVRDFL